MLVMKEIFYSIEVFETVMRPDVLWNFIVLFLSFQQYMIFFVRIKIYNILHKDHY